MELRLIAASPAEVESECLVGSVLDHGDKQKSEPGAATKDLALEKAMADLLASGEITGKAHEAAMLHRPQGLKAKRLLVVGGGKATSFNSTELRKAAGAALRYLKPKMIKSCAFIVPELTAGAEDALRSIVQGADGADLHPDTYPSQRQVPS